MRKLLVLLAGLWSFMSFSQQSEWEFYKDIDGVKFETRTIECSGNELLTFRISNMNDYSVNVLWKEEVWMDGICKQKGDSVEDERELRLLSREIKEGTCEFKESFYIGSKVKRGSRVMILTHFDLKNIKVSK